MREGGERLRDTVWLEKVCGISHEFGVGQNSSEQRDNSLLIIMNIINKMMIKIIRDYLLFRSCHRAKLFDFYPILQ